MLQIKATLRLEGNDGSHFEMDLPFDSSGAPILPIPGSSITAGGTLFQVRHHAWNYNDPDPEVVVVADNWAGVRV
jgi:hypothetical protein